MLNINEKGNIHERIEQLAEHFHKGNKAAFGRGADIQSGVLAGIIGGRKNKPSFEVLQKILTGYPTVSPDWLLFGRGPMIILPTELDNENPVSNEKASTGSLSQDLEDLREFASRFSKEDAAIWVSSLIERAGGIMQFMPAYLEGVKTGWTKEVNELYINSQAQAEANFLLEHAVWRLDGKDDPSRPLGGQLSERLGISLDEARQLVREGRIGSFCVGVSERITNHRVPEEAVREFLAQYSKEPK